MGLISRVSSRTYREKIKKWSAKNAPKKLGKIVTVDPLCHRAQNQGSSGTGQKSRKVGGNKLLEAKRTDRFNVNRQNGKTTHYRRCKICDNNVHQKHFRYCHKCSCMKGICQVCGVRLIKLDDRKMYKMSYK